MTMCRIINLRIDNENIQVVEIFGPFKDQPSTVMEQAVKICIAHKD